MPTITTFRCAKCAGIGKLTMARAFSRFSRVKAEPEDCFYCEGTGEIEREVFNSEDRQNNMRRLRASVSPELQSIRARERLGIPSGHHRVFGVDVPDALWPEVRRAANDFRHGGPGRMRLKISIEETAAFVRAMLDGRPLDPSFVTTALENAANAASVADDGAIRPLSREALMTGRVRRSRD